MAAIWDEDPKTWEANYWKSRKNLGMTKDTIARDVDYLKNWLKNHDYLPPLSGVVNQVIVNVKCVENEKSVAETFQRVIQQEVDENQWLENYLLLNKNDLERTKKNLDLYFKIRTILPEGFKDRSPHASDMYQSFKSVCLAVIPKLTTDGRMVVVFNHLTNRPSDFDVVPFAKRMISMIDIQLRSGIHRNGTILIMDLDTSRIGHLTRYQPLRLVRAFFTQVWADFRLFLRCYSDIRNLYNVRDNPTSYSLSNTAYPERVAQIHIINPPLILQGALAFFRPFLKEKMRKRIVVHSNLETLYEYVPKSHLPKDYGGECPDKLELNRRWEKVMLENEEWLKITAEKHKIPDDKWPRK